MKQINTNTEYDSYFWIKWEESSQDIPNNNTTIKWYCGVYCGHNFRSNAIKMSAFKIDGEQVYGGGTYSNFDAGNHQIASGQMTVQHNTDGTKTITISSFTGWLYASHNYSSNGGSYALTAIPRKATITEASNFKANENPSISFSNPGGFRMDVWLEPNPVGDHLCVRENIPKTGSYTWELTKDERDALRNKCADVSCPIRFGLYTYIDGVQYADYQDMLFSMDETDATRPSVTIDVTLDNSKVPSKFKDLGIQGKTKFNVKLTATGKYGATIKSYSSTVDGKKYTGSSFTTDVIQGTGWVRTEAWVTDSRYFKNWAAKSVNVHAYSKPLVIPLGSENAIQCYRSDENGNRVSKGNRVWIKAKRSYHDVEGNNHCALQWRVKLATDEWDDTMSPWADLIPASDTATDEYNALVPGATFHTQKVFTVQIRAIDDIGEYDIKTLEIPTEDVALHLGKGGKNVSIGTYCDYSTPYTFYSDWQGIFDKGLWGTSRNYNVTDVLTFAETCVDGLTPIIINDSTNKENLPEGNYAYSVGIVHKRAADQYNVILMDYVTGKIAINVHLSGVWTGWKYITPQ